MSQKDYFEVKTTGSYVGNGENCINTGLSFNPSMVIGKNRDSGEWDQTILHDSNRLGPNHKYFEEIDEIIVNPGIPMRWCLIDDYDVEFEYSRLKDSITKQTHDYPKSQWKYVYHSNLSLADDNETIHFSLNEKLMVINMIHLEMMKSLDNKKLFISKKSA